MLFKKKKNEDQRCISCGKGSNAKYNFCPHCGESKMDEIEEAEDFGLLGKSDDIAMNPMADSPVLEKIISTMMQTAVKTMMNEMKNPGMPKPEIKNFPNGIRITMNQPAKAKKNEQIPEQKITEAQIKKLESLPRAQAKAEIRRFSDKVVYELSASGVSSLEDIFISKLESGYEIKAISKNKIYVNTIQVNLPLVKYGLNDTSILLEFASGQ